MAPKEVVHRLRELQEEALALPPSTRAHPYARWVERTRGLLTDALGETHPLTKQFMRLRWTPWLQAFGDTEAMSRAFRAAVADAHGILDEAITELDDRS